MLIVKGKEKSASIDIEVDDYIPLKVEFGENALAAKIYWRALDGKYSLMEIGLSSEGKLISVTLTAISESRVSRSCKNMDVLETDDMPLFELANWSINEKDFSSRFIDEKVKLALVIGIDFATIEIDEPKEKLELIGSRKFHVGVDKAGSVRKIEVALNSSQIENLRRLG